MMYLFSITESKLNPDNVFSNLTQQDTIDLTDNRLKQFLSNIVANKDTIINKIFILKSNNKSILFLLIYIL